METKNIILAVLGAILKVVVIVAVVVIIFRGAETCFDYGYRIFTEPAVSAGEGRAVTVAVTAEMSPMDIGRLLESKGLVRDARLFALQYYLSEYRKDVGPGIFELNTAMTAEEMMAAMVVPEEETEETPDEASKE